MANERVRGNDQGPTGSTVAANVARARKTQEITLRELSDRLTERGRPISLSGLSKIESGERRVDVDDLVAIALALDVSPLGLLLPRGQYYELAEITGGRGSLPLIWKWAMGTDSLQYAGDDRAFSARSLPSWIESDGEYFDPSPAPATLELGWQDPGGPLRRHEVHNYTRNDGSERLLEDADDDD